MDQRVPAWQAAALARLLQQDATFLQRYKEAARDGRVEAVASGGRNYVAVRDPELARRIGELLPDAPRLAFDPATRRVAPER